MVNRMKDQKLFVFDIDGTILPEGGTLPQESIKAIKIIHDHGDLAVLATGRAYSQTIDIAKELEIKKYLICASGATVAHLDLQKIEIKSKIPKKIFDYFVKLAQTTKRQLNIKLVNGAIKYYFGDDVKKDIPDNSLFWKRGGTLNPTYNDYNNFEKDVDLSKVIAISIKAEPELVDKYFDKVKQEVQNIDPQFTAVIVSGVYLEAYKLGVNKSVEIKNIIKEESINENNVYVFGDSGNDIEMISDFENGIAMGNATDDVKAIAKKIIDSCHNHGVLKFIESFYKIKS